MGLALPLKGEGILGLALSFKGEGIRGGLGAAAGHEGSACGDHADDGDDEGHYGQHSAAAVRACRASGTGRTHGAVVTGGASGAGRTLGTLCAVGAGLRRRNRQRR